MTFRVLCILIVYCMAPLAAVAHEVRPASVELSETAPNEFEAVVKVPLVDGVPLDIQLVFPDTCTVQDVGVRDRSRVLEVTHWMVACSLRKGVLSVDGLDLERADIFVDIRYLGGDVTQKILRLPGDRVDFLRRTSFSPGAYIGIGFEHILSGPDHLLFVLGLLILAPLRKLLDRKSVV